MSKNSSEDQQCFHLVDTFHALEAYTVLGNMQEAQKNDRSNRWETGLGPVGWGGLKAVGFFSKVS